MTTGSSSSFSPRSILVLVLLVVLTGFVSSTVYGDLFLSYIGTMGMIEYSYLVVLFPLAVIVLIDLLARFFDPIGLSLDRLLLGTALFSSSLMFYFIYRVYSNDILQYGMVSFVFFLWSFIVLNYRPRELKYYLVLVFILALLIPPPLSWINYLSINLSHVMGYLASLLSGGVAEYVGDSLYVWITDASGVKRLFEITFACSGVVSLTSVLSIIPLILYLVLRSKAPSHLKVKGFILSILVSSAVTLLGNLFRLVLIFLVARFYDYNLAMAIFHQSPSLVYVVLAVVSSFIVLNKTLADRLWSFENIRGVSLIGNTLNIPLLLGLVLLILLSNAYVLFADTLTSELYSEGMIVLPTVKTIVENPLSTIFNNTGIRVLRNTPAPSLTVALGSSVVREITIEYNHRVLMGYLEVAETPSRFHGWYVCLTFQGYRVVKTWSMQGNISLNYMLLDKDGKYMLLAYSIFRIPVLFGNSTQMVYIRISFFTPTTPNNYEKDSFLLKQIFASISRNVEYTSSEKVSRLFEDLIIAVNVLIIVNIALILVAVLRNRIRVTGRIVRSRLLYE